MPTRRLAAIMFTDIAGYTRLMQESEARASQIRNRHREAFEYFHEQFKGQILQYYGDGTLSIFDSCVDAVKCAIAIQQELQKPPSVPLRIGIHLGDIVKTETDIYGDGVNVASRVESLGIPKTVLISDEVLKQIKNQEIDTVSMGRFTMKNVAAPMEVFAIKASGLILPKARQIQGKARRLGSFSSPLSKAGRWIRLVALGFATMALGATLFWTLIGSQGKQSPLSPEVIGEENVANKQPIVGGKIKIGGKHFIESSILLEIFAITIEELSDPEILVDRRHDHSEVEYYKERFFEEDFGEKIDLYPEYTGTMLSQRLKQDLAQCRNVRNHEKEHINSLINDNSTAYSQTAWLGDFGFHNGYTLVMSRQRIIDLGYDPTNISISILANISKDLIIGGDPEALSRSDCIKGLTKTYDIYFKEQIPIRGHDALYYRLIPEKVRERYKSEKQIDVIVGYTTDTQLLDNTFVQIRDDRSFFIKYFGGGLVRKEILEKFKLNKLDQAFKVLEDCFRDKGEADHLQADERMRRLIKKVESVLDENKEQLITMENLRADKNPKAGKELRKIVRNWLMERGII